MRARTLAVLWAGGEQQDMSRCAAERPSGRRVCVALLWAAAACLAWPAHAEGAGPVQLPSFVVPQLRRARLRPQPPRRPEQPRRQPPAAPPGRALLVDDEDAGLILVLKVHSSHHQAQPQHAECFNHPLHAQPPPCAPCCSPAHTCRSLQPSDPLPHPQCHGTRHPRTPQDKAHLAALAPGGACAPPAAAATAPLRLFHAALPAAVGRLGASGLAALRACLPEGAIVSVEPDGLVRRGG